MTTSNILIVDSDEGFGTMLREGLNGSDHYKAECVATGRQAMNEIMAGSFDLVIIDLGLADVPPLKLIKAIRKAKQDIKIMVIPLIGQQLPENIEERLKINGILTKPFFVGDLPEMIDKALDRVPRPPAQLPTAPSPVTEPAEDTGSDKLTPPGSENGAGEVKAESSPASQPLLTGLPKIPQETVRYLRANETEILRLLDDLNREVRAEAILLIAGQEMIAQAGLLKRDACRDLALLVAQSTQAAAQAADFLGERNKRFAQSLHEGKEYKVYTLTLKEGILLSLALSSNVPLGMIRHQCRQIANQLGKFI
ncbi:MAG: response regulator [Anaerolineae bacterium]|nr:response regulator [Anaerolineae bacterium]